MLVVSNIDLNHLLYHTFAKINTSLNFALIFEEILERNYGKYCVKMLKHLCNNSC